MARPRKNPLTIDKICPTCQKTFTISSRKNRQIFCSKTCAQHNPVVLDKMRQSQNKTFNEKYGGHPMKTNRETVDKFKTTLFKNHGDDYFTNYLVEQTKKTKKEKYGDENYNNIEKSKQTCLKKYGVDNPCKSIKIKEQICQTIMSKHYDDLLEFCKKENIKFLCSKEEYGGYHFSKIYKFQCLKCNYIFENTVYNLEHIFCEKCEPNRKSTLENEFFDFLTSILETGTIIRRRDRMVLNGKELDFYIPSKNIAIELNGLYWHSEIGGKINKLYHLYKTKSCIFHGVKLIHIFETEWNNQKDIVKSIIKNLISATDEKIYARNCILTEISPKEKDEFLNQNHLQGTDKSTIKLALIYNSKIVSVMTFKKGSRFDKNFEWELMRYCNKINTSVIGGASKLFTYFVNNYKPASIVSYSDRRYFDGNIYKTLGFNFINFTSPGYYYITNNYKGIVHRLNFQKYKLKNILPLFNENLSEWENMKNNGFDRIWDCGHSKWVIQFNYTNQANPLYPEGV